MSREELIEILEHCMKDDCNGCPNHYSDGHVACDDYIYGMSASMPVARIQDAVDLLKEQMKLEPEKVFHVADRSINETHGKTGFCPRCNQLVVWEINRRYCGFCGKGLKWDD